MKYDPPLQEARLIRRYKRFLADIELPDGQQLTIHCPNTGSMLNCGGPGSRIWYSTSDNPGRKYANTFEQVELADGSIAGIHTGRANALVQEGIENGLIAELQGYEQIQREQRFGEEKSRIDFLLRGHASQTDCFVEVKSVTLARGDGLGEFPDAVTTRGQRHLRDLMRIVQEGRRAVLMFCVQHTGIRRVAAARTIDPDYADALEQARAAGVEVLAYGAEISPEEIRLVSAVPLMWPD